MKGEYSHNNSHLLTLCLSAYLSEFGAGACFVGSPAGEEFGGRGQIGEMLWDKICNSQVSLGLGTPGYQIILPARRGRVGICCRNEGVLGFATAKRTIWMPGVISPGAKWGWPWDSRWSVWTMVCVLDHTVYPPSGYLFCSRGAANFLRASSMIMLWDCRIFAACHRISQHTFKWRI